MCSVHRPNSLNKLLLHGKTILLHKLHQILKRLFKNNLNIGHSFMCLTVDFTDEIMSDFIEIFSIRTHDV